MISSQGAGVCFAPFKRIDAVLNKVSMVNVDFPPPETPVTHVKVANGNDAFIPFRLFPDALIISIFFPLPFRLLFGIFIFFIPLKYCPVMDFLFLII